MSERVWIIGPNGAVRTGHFKARLVKGGPYVAVRCWIEDGDRDPETNELLSDQITRLDVDGEEVQPFARKGYVLMGEPITKAEFDYMTAIRGHAVEYEPDLPQANPTAPVNLMTAPSPF